MLSAWPFHIFPFEKNSQKNLTDAGPLVMGRIFVTLALLSRMLLMLLLLVMEAFWVEIFSPKRLAKKRFFHAHSCVPIILPASSHNFVRISDGVVPFFSSPHRMCRGKADGKEEEAKKTKKQSAEIPVLPLTFPCLVKCFRCGIGPSCALRARSSKRDIITWWWNSGNLLFSQLYLWVPSNPLLHRLRLDVQCE